MSTNLDQASKAITAQLSFLTIYNPSLGRTDESLPEQIVFYSSPAIRARRSRRNVSGSIEDAVKEEENEQLRQVGLAQGMVDFANNFSDGETIDTIETERSRIVLHQLEPNWWILASVDLSRLPPARSNDQEGFRHQHAIEYSSREVSPPQLMLQHLLRAHSVFLLHHAATLTGLYSRISRPSFCTLLDRFWTRFIWNWDVLLHGNPAVDIYNGIKLAGGGELGIGVGEEEWGSGEREVLEDFIARTEGLVDLVVSRFGEAPEESPKVAVGQKSTLPPKLQKASWLAADLDPRPSDGVLFSGVGAISRKSLTTVSQWMADIYRYGRDAYGVGENPTGRPRRKKRKLSPKTTQVGRSSREKGLAYQHIRSRSRGRSMNEREVTAPRIPPPLVKVVEQSLENATAKAGSNDLGRIPKKEQRDGVNEQHDDLVFGTEKMMKYLSLGYGSSWTLNPKGFSRSQSQPVSQRISQLRSDKKPEEGSDSETSNEPDPPQLDLIDPTPEVSDHEDDAFVQHLERSIGRFLIGLSGDLEAQDLVDDTDNGPRIVLRTLTLEMNPHSPTSQRHESMPSTPSEFPPTPSDTLEATSSPPRHKQLQVAIYVHQPFIFTFLFELHSPSLALPSFYRSIHHQLGPLQKPLLRSTNPANVAARIASAMGEGTSTSPTTPGKRPPPIYDLIYDPEKLTIHGSLPNIPPPASLTAEGLAPQTVSGSWYTLGIPTSSSSSTPTHPSTTTTQTASGTHSKTLLGSSHWTRVEALSVHTQILNTYLATRRLHGELERTVKTGRGWWVLWMRVQGSVNADARDEGNWGEAKEAVLVRRARDGGGIGGGGRQQSGMGMGMGMGWLAREQRRDASGSSAGGGGGGGSNNSVASVSEGVGVDARRWVEALLSLNR